VAVALQSVTIKLSKNYNDFGQKMESYFLCVHLLLALMSIPIIQSNYKNINSVFMGLKAFKAIKYFIISGTKNKIGF